ncbi:MAG: 4-hydroxy-3-methylbut-2-enyl diphosphate reductase [Thermodesulfobacteriota bacterium]
MKIRLARSSGFCMGVRRAMEMALDAVHGKKGPIYSYGPLIHNPQAMNLLESKGLRVIEAEKESLAGLSGAVIIRAHGITPGERLAMESRGLEIIDATCPRVIRVQAIIGRHAAKGYGILIWGNRNHPEVRGLVGHAAGKGHVISGPGDVAALPDMDRVILVAQTTQNQNLYAEVTAAVQARWPEALVFDTICDSTRRRQDDVRGLAREVQAMVVVGGHTSGNTRRLAAVAEAEGVKTLHVETDDEIEPSWLEGLDSVGVTAGASTPNWMIKRVLRRLEHLARHGRPSLRNFGHRLLRAVILGNVYAALGAGLLCLAGAMLQDLAPDRGYFGVAFFYVHAMHMLNLFLDKEAAQFNDPDRALFVEQHRTVLLGSGVFSALVSLALSFLLGWKVLALLVFMSTLGLLYAVPLVPRGWTRITRFRRLKDIPTSKTLSVSGGWAVSLALIPALSPQGTLSWSTALVGLVIFLMVFVRSALGDVLDIQGDRIVGRETIPIIMGEKNTRRLLSLLSAGLAALLLLGRLTGLLTPLAPWLLVCAAHGALCLALSRRQQIMGSGLFEALIDANFILAGLVSWLWWTAVR